MDVPETRYAKSGDVRIAYQVIGRGSLDLVFVPGFVSNLEIWWEEPFWAEFWGRLAAFSRLILFDKRGTGLSDRTAHVGNLENRMDDVRAVMDAAHSQRAALFGVSEGGPMSLLFAATYPQRVHALVLYGSYARHPTLSPELLKQNIDLIDRDWGTGQFFARTFVPSKASDEAYRRGLGRRERLAASPSAAISILQMNSEIDARHILTTIQVPTLVLHRVGDHRITVDAGRYLATHIPGAKYVELPGTDHVPFDITDRIANEVEEFLTGSRSEADADRVLATVMFTDIVASTRRAAEVGDRGWRAILASHNDVVRQELTRFRGREVKTLGDGFLATFDGPARAVRCASAIVEQIRQLGIEVRAGLHTGEIEFKAGDVGGIAVNVAARIAELAGRREVLVSSTVRDLVAGSSLRFHDRGSHQLRGLHEPVRLFQAQA